MKQVKHLQQVALHVGTITLVLLRGGGRLIPGARFWGTSCIKANMAFKLLVSDTVGGVEQEVTS